jgi:hypothetical protein
VPSKFPCSTPCVWIAAIARVTVMLTLPHGVLLYQGS